MAPHVSSIPQMFDEPDDNEGNERRANRQSSSSGIPMSRSFSISDVWNRDLGEEISETARIPSLVQSSSGEVYYSAPLPKLSMLVLSIAMLAEFLSASVAGPFLLFMVKGFDIIEDASEAAYWTGVLVSAFFLAQFLTSLLWATVAEHYSPRTVVSISLFGSAISTLAFGTSDSLAVAMFFRFLQGVFAGSIGVAKGSIGAVTDTSNEGQAYAILGFCWGLGGIAGAVIGGTFESPALKWPSVITPDSTFAQFPYALPCLIAASVMVIGSFLACFLGPDLGPRAGKASQHQEKVTIPLPSDENLNDDRRTSVGSMGYLKNRLSEMFHPSNTPRSDRTPLLFSCDLPFEPSSPQTSNLQSSGKRNSGYSAIVRQGYPLDRNKTMTVDSACSDIRRRGSQYSNINRRSAQDANLNDIYRRRSNRFSRYGDVEEGYQQSKSNIPKRTSLVERLVMANENALGVGIADFWVAAAISLEGSSGVEDYDGNEGEDVQTRREGSTDVCDDEDAGSVYSRYSTNETNAPRTIAYPSSPSRPFFGRQTSETSGLPTLTRNFTPTSPRVVRDTEGFFPRTETTDSGLRVEPALQPILESRRVSTFYDARGGEVDEFTESEDGSLPLELPLAIIAQYGLLAFHSTTHDQVFMSYLVTPFESGGLSLTAGDFAQITGLMCLFQIFYQFYLYPNVGPPRGPLSYLALFRIGCFLFIPSYLVVILYRDAFASPDSSAHSSLMLSLTLSTAMRYCGTTFGYTSISILLNYMTPPHAVGYANGVAQSIVSLARCIGPILGGSIWSYSTQDSPAGYWLGFVVCAAICVVGILHSFFLR